jgi:hypothetical protein
MALSTPLPPCEPASLFAKVLSASLVCVFVDGMVALRSQDAKPSIKKAQ